MRARIERVLVDVFRAEQAAAFTFASSTLNGAALVLKASGSFNALGYYTDAIRVRYATGGGTAVVVETTTNGLSFTQRAQFSATFASGNTLTALADASGTVYVWKTAAATTTFIGQVTLPTTGQNSFTTGGGRIGMYLPSGARVDDFKGGNAP